MPTHDDSSSKSFDSVRIDRLLAGEGTAADHAWLRAWRAEHPDEQLLAKLVTACVTQANDTEPVDLMRGWNAVAQRVGNQTSTNVSRNASQLGTSIVWLRHRIATVGMVASAVIAVALGVTRWPSVAPTHRFLYGIDVATNTTMYSTRVAQRARLTLRDGTEVLLAPNTTLALSKDYGRADRSVTLSGEAYFNVASNSALPLVVHTDRVTTRVLGTTFTVRKYTTDADVHVAVTTGKVVTEGRRARITVSAGMVARVTDSTATMATANLDAYTDWTRGRLVFKNARVPDVLATVGRWYGYDFKLADSSLAAQHVSVIFTASDGEEMLVMLKDVLDVSMAFEGHTITLNPHRSSAHRPVPALDVFTSSVEKGR